jgi:hypothetical protein
MPAIGAFDKSMLDAILLHAAANNLTLISVTRKDNGEAATFVCCQIVEDGRTTIVPVALMVDIATFETDYHLPPEFADLAAMAARHDIEVTVPGAA